MIRVCFALGTWQLVTLAAGLRQAGGERLPPRPGGERLPPRPGGERLPPRPGEKDHEDVLVLYETVEATDALKQAMAEVAGAVWPWKRIVWAFDLMASVRRRIPQRRFDFLLGRLREHLGIAGADELWFCWLTRPPEKLILEAYPRARVVLYEDGLTSYLPVPVTPDENAQGGLPLLARARAWLTRTLDERRPVRRFRRYKSRLDPRHAERLSGVYLVLTDVAPVPEAFAHAPCHTVETRFLRETLAACAGLPSVALTPSPEEGAAPPILVLGQSLYRWDVLSRDQELAVYRQVIETILAKGYSVLWKEHPRVQEPFFPDLAQSVAPGRLRELELPFALPVELVAERLGLSGCVAGISAALFYLPRLYDIPAYTFAGDLSSFMRDQWAIQNEMVRKAVPPLGALPAAGQEGD